LRLSGALGEAASMSLPGFVYLPASLFLPGLLRLSVGGLAVLRGSSSPPSDHRDRLLLSLPVSSGARVHVCRPQAGTGREGGTAPADRLVQGVGRPRVVELRTAVGSFGAQLPVEEACDADGHRVVHRP
jgi:hypothetical protein